MVLDIIIAMSCGGAGLACGWVMHAFQNVGDLMPAESPMPPKSAPSASPKLVEDALDVVLPGSGSGPGSAPADRLPSREKLSEMATRLNQFSLTIAEDVDSHQSTVEAINVTLHDSDLSQAPPVVVGAVDDLLLANELMRQKLELAQQRLREQTKQLQSAEERAQTDALTQIGNRVVFDAELAGRGSMNPPIAGGFLVLLDVDHFKQFNDTHGHLAGDEVLRSLARLLEARLQPHGVVTRYGGEEFAAFLDGDSLDSAVELIEKTRQAIQARTIRFDGKSLHVTISIGVARRDPSESSADWVARVDDAMYESKKVGRNATHYWKDGRMHRAGGSDPTLDVAAPETSPLAAGDHRESADEMTQLHEDVTTLLEEVQTPSTTDEDLLSVAVTDRGERPKSLRYLPDRGAMTVVVEEMMALPVRGERTHFLAAVRLSGQPTAATLRSVLQLVRAVISYQDHIGCLDGATLLVAMPALTPTEARDRGEQICVTAESAGIALAIDRRAAVRSSAADESSADDADGNDGERLSVGLLQLPTIDHSHEPIMTDVLHRWLDQAVALSELAGKQNAKQVTHPLLTHRLT